MGQLERYLSRAVLDRAPRRTRKTRKRGLLALCLDYVQFPVRDRAFMAWIRLQPSCVSGRFGCQAAHTGTDGGMRVKASDRSCVPLTPTEHREYHRIGKRAFEALYTIDFRAIVQKLNEQYNRR